MPVIASDAPIIVERAHEGGPPLVLRVNRYGPDYGPDGFGETEIISCADERLQSKYPSLNGAAGRACQQLYGTTFGLNDSFKVYVAATNPADDSLLDELARAPEAALKQLRSRADIAGLRLTQLEPGERTHATALPVRRLLPLVPDGTPTEQIGSMLAGAQSGKRKERADDDDGQMEKRPVKYKAGKGDIVFFTGGVAPHVVLGVEHRPPRIPNESGKWLVVTPLPVVAGEHREVHASEFVTLNRATLTAAWDAACALSDSGERETRRRAVVDAVTRQAAVRNTKTPLQLWTTLCPDYACPSELYLQQYSVFND